MIDEEIREYEEEDIVHVSGKQGNKPYNKKSLYKKTREMQVCTESFQHQVNCPFQKQKKFTIRSKAKRPTYGCTYEATRNSQIYCTTKEFRREH